MDLSRHGSEGGKSVCEVVESRELEIGELGQHEERLSLFELYRCGSPSSWLKRVLRILKTQGLDECAICGALSLSVRLG